MEQTLEIKVDPPEGWLAVDYRVPRNGEHFINAQRSNDVVMCTDAASVAGPRIIVVRKFEFPACVKKGMWYAVDADGSDWLFEEKPSIGVKEWHPTTARMIGGKFARKFFDFPEAPKGDWKLSLLQKQ